MSKYYVPFDDVIANSYKYGGNKTPKLERLNVDDLREDLGLARMDRPPPEKKSVVVEQFDSECGFKTQINYDSIPS